MKTARRPQCVATDFRPGRWVVGMESMRHTAPPRGTHHASRSQLAPQPECARGKRFAPAAVIGPHAREREPFARPQRIRPLFRNGRILKPARLLNEDRSRMVTALGRRRARRRCEASRTSAPPRFRATFYPVLNGYIRILRRRAILRRDAKALGVTAPASRALEVRTERRIGGVRAQSQLA